MSIQHDIQCYSQLADVHVKLACAEADVLNKYEQANVTHQEAIRKELQNLSLFQNIQWDQQAHHNLIRMGKEKLKDVRNLERTRDTMNKKVREVRHLITNTMQWDCVRDGWLAFAFLSSRTPTTALSKAYAITPEDDAYRGSSFEHIAPTGLNRTCEDYKGQKNGALLLNWARTKSYLPLMGLPAWTYVTQLIEAFAEGVKLEAAKLQMQLELAEKAANEIQTRDWDRLKSGPRTTTG